jgi:hypothetical protein
MLVQINQIHIIVDRSKDQPIKNDEVKSLEKKLLLGCVWFGREIVKREIGEKEFEKREIMRNRVDLMGCLE